MISTFAETDKPAGWLDNRTLVGEKVLVEFSNSSDDPQEAVVTGADASGVFLRETSLDSGVEYFLPWHAIRMIVAQPRAS